MNKSHNSGMGKHSNAGQPDIIFELENTMMVGDSVAKLADSRFSWCDVVAFFELKKDLNDLNMFDVSNISTIYSPVLIVFLTLHRTLERQYQMPITFLPKIHNVTP